MTDEFAIKILEQYREKPTLINEIETVEEAVWLDEALAMGIKALKQEPRWIPVSEKYPKPEDEYKPFLVTDDKGVISVQVFYLSIEKEPQPYFSGMVNVIAWMPLPKPYEPQKSEDDA